MNCLGYSPYPFCYHIISASPFLGLPQVYIIHMEDTIYGIFRWIIDLTFLVVSHFIQTLLRSSSASSTSKEIKRKWVYFFYFGQENQYVLKVWYYKLIRSEYSSPFFFLYSVDHLKYGYNNKKKKNKWIKDL